MLRSLQCKQDFDAAVIKVRTSGLRYGEAGACGVGAPCCERLKGYEQHLGTGIIEVGLMLWLQQHMVITPLLSLGCLQMHVT